MSSFCGPASAEERKGNESDGRFTQDQQEENDDLAYDLEIRRGE